MANVRNYEEYRAEVLERLGDDYTVEDLRNTERWRLRVLDMLSGGGSGGGGESDFSTAKLTYEVVGHVTTPPIYISRIWDNAMSSLIPVAGTYDVVLYKGLAYGILETDANVSVEGSIEYDDGDLIITGDCTITIS